LLQTCLANWEQISAITNKNYYEVPYFKADAKKDNPAIDLFSWKKYLPEVEEDIRTARSAVSNKK
jgi:hypothetical protein